MRRVQHMQLRLQLPKRTGKDFFDNPPRLIPQILLHGPLPDDPSLRLAREHLPLRQRKAVPLDARLCRVGADDGDAASPSPARSSSQRPRLRERLQAPADGRAQTRHARAMPRWLRRARRCPPALPRCAELRCDAARLRHDGPWQLSAPKHSQSHSEHALLG